MSHNEPVFELLKEEHHHCGCDEDHHFRVECGREHRIYGEDFQFLPGDFIYWDSTQLKYLSAVEGKCDLLVLRVDRYGTWIEAANIGEFKIKNFTLKGALYLNSLGELTNTQTTTKLGFIENGHLYLNI